MILLKLKTLAEILCGEAFGNNVILDTVITDSRKITRGCLFIALKGKYFDAHNFAIQAKKSNAGALLVSRKLNIDIPQVVVKDTRVALGNLAAWVRRKVPTRVVALTGSSGKTSVKEMAAAILSHCGNTLYTEGNLNNDIGVAMTLLRLTKEHTNAVIELGARCQGEIAWTVSLTYPEAALVNNFTISHIKSFGSLKNIAKSKGEIYSGLAENGIAIINSDNNDWKNWKSVIGLRKTWSFSLNTSNSDFTANNIYLKPYNTEFTLQTPIGNIRILLPLPGRHNVANALAASALSMAIGAPLTAIKSGLENLKSIPGRVFPIFLTKDQVLIDDSYNANLASMREAVQVLSMMPGYRVIVLGDMAELGSISEACHFQIGKIVKASGIDRVFTIGVFSQIISETSGLGEHYKCKRTLIKDLKSLIKKHKIITVLVKGSRSSAMEEVVYGLQGNSNVSFFD